jgi:hypothetical protein
MVVDLPESASHEGIIGEVQTWASGYVDTAGADPTVLGILAQAGHNDSSAGDSDIAVIVATPQTIFEANLAQAAANTTAAATSLGTAYGIIARSTGTAWWVIDSSDTSNTRLRILKRRWDHAATDVNARFEFTFFVANCALVA